MLFPETTGAQLDQVMIKKKFWENSEPNKLKNKKLRRSIRENKDLQALLVIVIELEKVLTIISTFMK